MQNKNVNFYTISIEIDVCLIKDFYALESSLTYKLKRRAKNPLRSSLRSSLASGEAYDVVS